MELFVRGVDFSCDYKAVDRAVARVLHTDPSYARFSSGGLPLNFGVYLFPKKGDRRRHRGFGTLTLPTVEVGRQFMRDYGAPSPARPLIRVGNRYLQFSHDPARNEARRDILERITSRPYIDPAALEEDERRAELLDHKRVKLQLLQFGYECRDWVFSPELDVDCAGTAASITFDQDSRALRIEFETDERWSMVMIRFSNISSHAAGLDAQGCPALFFSLIHPPQYNWEPRDNGSESDDPLSLLSLLRDMARDGQSGVVYSPKRFRATAFDTSHKPIAPYCSHALRAVCSSSADLAAFHELADAAGLVRAKEYYPRIERRDLCLAGTMDQYRTWLKSLAWRVAFQLEVMTRSLWFTIPEVLRLQSRIEATLRLRGRHFTVSLLKGIYEEISGGSQESVGQCYDRCREGFIPPPRIDRRGEDLYDCFHVDVTPTSLRLSGPFPERSNRVIRENIQHSDCFLRVAFVEEDKLHFGFDQQYEFEEFVRQRVGTVLKDGLEIGGRRLKFLAYSQSALKEHATIFMKPFRDEQRGEVNAQTIISSLGNFHEARFDKDLAYCPARYGARISQAFTSTDQGIEVDVTEQCDEADIRRNSWVFTDGVGTISEEMAEAIRHAVYSRRNRRRPAVDPTVFQIRFQGAKGVVSVDYRLTGRKMVLRPSMIKYEAAHFHMVEIAQTFDKPGPFYLNRPLIMVLEGDGVPYENFKIYQDAAVRDAKDSVNSLEATARLLEGHGLGTSYRLPSVMAGLRRLGITSLNQDPFYLRTIEFAIHHVLREIKHKARIPVPGGWHLVGVADVHEYLQPGEIFVCVHCPGCSKDFYLEGDTIVSRSPTCAPGDVQRVTAVGRPAPGTPYSVQPLRNSIVFSVLVGDRPLPSMLGGGDLDGDTYNVWSSSYECACMASWSTIPLASRSLLIPEKKAPEDYPAATKRKVQHKCTMEDVKSFVTDYIISNNLGMVSTRWLLIADRHPQGIFSNDCKILSKLCSRSVDFAKSGNPVDWKDIPKGFREKPDWHAPETQNPAEGLYYQSQRAIGRLFRSIDLPAVSVAKRESRRQRRLADSGEDLAEVCDCMCEVSSHEPAWHPPIREVVEAHVAQHIDLSELHWEEVKTASRLFRHYAGTLREHCAHNSVSQARGALLTEEEALAGTIVAKTAQARRRQELISRLREDTDIAVRDVRAELRGTRDGDALETRLYRAWVAWRLSVVEHAAFGGMSFWWITLGAVLDAVRAIDDRNRELERRGA